MAASAASEKKASHSIRVGAGVTGVGSNDLIQPDPGMDASKSNPVVRSNDSSQPDPGMDASKSYPGVGIKDSTQADPWMNASKSDPGFLRVILCSVPVLLLLGLLLYALDGQPIAQLWTIALVLCSYIFFFVMFVCTSVWPFTVLTRISYGLLLAHSASFQISPRCGVCILLLCTACAAGYFGYVLASHRLHIGTERAIGALPKPAFLSEFHAHKFTHNIGWTAFFTTVAAVAAVALCIYLLDPSDLILTVCLLSAASWFYISLWAIVVHQILLYGVLVPKHVLSDMPLFVTSLAIFALLSLAGDIIFLLASWLWMMAVAAFLGYSIQVYTRYLLTVPWFADDSDVSIASVSAEEVFDPVHL